MSNINPVRQGVRLPAIGEINSYLLILLSFFFMTSIAIGNILLFLIFALWLLEGRFGEKINKIKNNPFVWAVMLFVTLHFLGLLWTSDWSFAGFILKKEIKYLLIPVLMTVMRREHLPYYVGAFLLSMVLLVTVSYGLFSGIVPLTDLWVDDVMYPTPFVHHIVYNPVLAFTLYLLLYAIFMMEELAFKWKIVAAFLFLTMAVNMFMTTGRMGQLVFFILVALFVFQYFRKSILKPFLLALVLVPGVALIAYHTSPVMQDRVDRAIHEIQNYEQEPNSSIGLRVIMLLNSFEIIKDNPLFGVGTGDYEQEYRKVNRENYPEAVRGEILRHPHNVYVQQMVQFGLLGLIVLLYLFYTMWKLYQDSSSRFRPIMLAFPLFLAVIFCSDGYMMNHYLTILFLLFGSLLYGNWEQKRE